MSFLLLSPHAGRGRVRGLGAKLRARVESRTLTLALSLKQGEGNKPVDSARIVLRARGTHDAKKGCAARGAKVHNVSVDTSASAHMVRTSYRVAGVCMSVWGGARQKRFIRIPISHFEGE